MFDTSRYTIAWLCALPIELQAAKLHLDEKHDPTDFESELNDNNTYLFGSIGKHSVVIASLPRGEYGVNSAAIVARDLLRSFTNVRIGFMVGIAGGAPLMELDLDQVEKQDIRLGDVVVSTPGNSQGGVCQYDYGKTQQNQPFLYTAHLNSPPAVVLTAITALETDLEEDCDIHNSVSEILASRHGKIRERYSRPDITTDCLYKSSFVHPDSKKPCSVTCTGDDGIVSRPTRVSEEIVIHYGLIASGNKLVRDALFRNKLASDLRVLCFEMEAAGLMNQSTFTVIRGICDYCDTHKNKLWQGYAAMTAAAYAKRLLLKLVPSKVMAESKISELEEIRKYLKKHELNDEVKQLKKKEEAAKDLKISIMNWLAAPNPETNFQSAVRLREHGTGKWLMQDLTYINWKNGKSHHIWLHGKAGSGKSVLSARVIDDCQEYCSHQVDVGYAIFYFSFSDANKQSYQHLLHSLVSQVACRDKPTAALIQAYKKLEHATRGDPNIESNLRKVFIDSIDSYKRFFLILDGLDECDETSGSSDQADKLIRTREELLQWLQKLSFEVQNLQLFVTSRDLWDIRSSMSKMGCCIIDMAAPKVGNDIWLYTVNQLNKDSDLNRLEIPLKQKILQTFMERSDGMFRWAVCQIDELKTMLMHSAQPSDIDYALKYLPVGLDATYDRMLNRIPLALKQKTLAMLRWLTYAMRPLTLAELSETRIIYPDEIRNNVRTCDRGPIEDVLRLLSALIIVDQTYPRYPLGAVFHYDRTVRLAHFSVREYLESDRILQGAQQMFHLHSSRDQQILSTCCVMYLMHHTNRPERDVEGPLTKYAAAYWYDHCRDTGQVSQEIEFLKSPIFIREWLRIHSPENPERKIHLEWLYIHFPGHLGRGIYLEGSGLYYASLLGLENIVTKLIEGGAYLDAVGGEFGSALKAACHKGHTAIFKILIEAGADVNAGHEYSASALQLASDSNSELIAKMLIDAGVDVDDEDDEYDNALVLAIRNRNPIIVEMLIAAKVDVNCTRDLYGRAMQVALEVQDHVIILMLIDAGADVDVNVEGYGTFLLTAFDDGAYDPTLVRMLIQAGADIHGEGGASGTPLHLAARNGDIALVKDLINAGLDVNKTIWDDETVLSVARESGHEGIVQLLIEAGAQYYANDDSSSSCNSDL